jgi:nitroreductase
MDPSTTTFKPRPPIGIRPALASRIEWVRHATLAASSHNTQPWKFGLEPDRIVILPDLSRRCPEVDPDDHHLYASLGCATENLVLAAQAEGFRCRVSYQAASSSLQVDLESAKAVRSPRFDAIPWRQCSRAKYDGTSLTSEQLRQLEEAGRSPEVSVMFLTEHRQKEQLAEYVAAGNAAQFSDARWVAEMKKWIRFNASDALRTGDGLYGATLGIPNVPRWLGRAVMRAAVSAQSQSDKDRSHIHSSGAIAVLFSASDDKQHWVEAGRSYERLALQASALGLSSAFINQPVEVAALRSQLAAHLGIGNHRPDLIVRLGYGPRMPRSLRRPVEQVLV